MSANDDNSDYIYLKGLSLEAIMTAEFQYFASLLRTSSYYLLYDLYKIFPNYKNVL